MMLGVEPTSRGWRGKVTASCDEPDREQCLKSYPRMCGCQRSGLRMLQIKELVPASSSSCHLHDEEGDLYGRENGASATCSGLLDRRVAQAVRVVAETYYSRRGGQADDELREGPHRPRAGDHAARRTAARGLRLGVKGMNNGTPHAELFIRRTRETTAQHTGEGRCTRGWKP